MSISRNMLEAIVGPQFDHHLLEELREVFPPVTPIPTDTVSQIMYTAGQRSVVEWLTKRMEDELNEKVFKKGALNLQLNQ